MSCKPCCPDPNKMNLQFMTNRSQEVLTSLRESSQAMEWPRGGVKAELCSVSTKRGDALVGAGWRVSWGLQWG